MVWGRGERQAEGIRIGGGGGGTIKTKRGSRGRSEQQNSGADM